MLVVAVALAMAVGLVGTILPVLPGLVLVAGAAAAYGVGEGFGGVGVVAMSLIAVLGVAGTLAGVIVPNRAARASGAARASVLLGAALAVAGFFLVPVVGLPLGGVVGIYLGERARTGDEALARRTTMATLRAFGIAALLQLGAGLLMVATWVVWVLA